jgi:GT2 family glycosyltransferase
MSDPASPLSKERNAQSGDGAIDDLIRIFPVETFDEAGYLRAYPDVAEALSNGLIKSGYIHFISNGLREGRMPSALKNEPRGRLIQYSTAFSPAGILPFAQNVETIVISKGGGVLVIGWVDDGDSSIDVIRILGRNWRLTFEGGSLARVRRQDVEDSLGRNVSHAYGYFGFLFADQVTDASGDFRVEVCLKDGRSTSSVLVARLVEELELRNIVLSYLAAAGHFGNAQVKGIACIDRGLGVELIRHNRGITDRVTASPYIERFGPWTHRHRASIVVCLYGKIEYLFVQNALFSMGRGIEDYEFIYVCNSPELAESLLREAQVASSIYGIDQTIVILPGNAGFGGANNAAVRAATTDRILIVNPDVFPYDRDWAAKHTDIVASLPLDQTRLFGAPLYYDDGSLMHGGMYFEVDSGPSTEGGRTVQWQLVRVEHYGKGAPASSGAYTSPRPVPAVTGAFISCDRAWYEKLGGFTEDYIFGHYEDADLCLKSIEAGALPWLQDIKMWHLEGKGSTRLPVHNGGSLVNRWIFSSKWGATISDGLLGPHPANPAFRLSGQPFPAPPPGPAAAPVPLVPLIGVTSSGPGPWVGSGGGKGGRADGKASGKKPAGTKQPG